GALLTVAVPGSRDPSSYWLPGDRLMARLTLKPFRNFKNPNSFDYSRYQAEKGFHASAFLKDENLVTRLASGPELSSRTILHKTRGKIDLFRQKALFWMTRTLEPESAGFYAALLLGYQHFLEKAWQDRIQRTGMNHLITVSGLHLGLVSLLVFYIVRSIVRITCPVVLNRISANQIAVWPALACAVVYAFLAGFGVPPIWRSVLMLAVCYGAAFRYRSPDPLTMLAFAALIILAHDPNCLWQISFQLTFACVLSIILIYPKFRNLQLSHRLRKFQGGRTPARVLSKFEEAFFAGIAVSVLVLPLTVFHFNGFSVAGFAANIILVPYVGLMVLPWGLACLAVFALSEPTAFPLMQISEHLLAFCLYLIEWLGSYEWSYFWTGSMSLFWLFLIYCGLALLLWPLSVRKRLAGLGILALFVAGQAWTSPDSGKSNALRVDVIDVGQGSAALIRFPSGEAMLVDGGGFSDDSFDVGRAVVAPFLWHSGVRRLEHVVLSHDHPDHRNGLRFILAHFETGHFWTSGITESQAANGTAKTAPTLERIANSRGIPIRSFPDLSSGMQIGGAHVRVVHPRPELLDRKPRYSLNDLSMVLEIEFGDTVIILPGDIGSGVEREIIPAITGDKKVLLVSAHHGSDNSNSEEFLDALKPCAIIFSCGHGNPFGFPAKNVLGRCAERNIPVHRTDLDGAVHAVSDGREWSITVQERAKDEGLFFRGHTRQSSGT
ncbi:MAG: DNA internalization-related competence protein ComEC/Rec2, partial [Syntrophobacteraceae bacterium]